MLHYLGYDLIRYEQFAVAMVIHCSYSSFETSSLRVTSFTIEI